MINHITKQSRRNIKAENLDTMAQVLKTIAHPVRLEIVELLESNERMTVTQILQQINVEQSLLSHHLAKMKDKGVLKAVRDGRTIFYELALRQITSIFDCMEHCNIFK